MTTYTNVKIKRVGGRNHLPIPQYATSQSAGLDVMANIDEPITLYHGVAEMIPTGFAVELHAGYEFQVRSRSGLSLKGITVANSPGTIDADYRGEIKVLLVNSSSMPFIINGGDRIAQLVLARVPQAIFEEVEELSDTVRGTGGFGSTGA